MDMRNRRALVSPLRARAFAGCVLAPWRVRWRPGIAIVRRERGFSLPEDSVRCDWGSSSCEPTVWSSRWGGLRAPEVRCGVWVASVVALDGGS